MQIPQPICMKCKHFTPSIKEDGMFYCKAFPTKEPWTAKELKERLEGGNMLDPKGIPDEILFGENPHTSPIEGQVGDFVFTEGEPEDLPQEQPQETLKKRSKVVNIKK